MSALMGVGVTGYVILVSMCMPTNDSAPLKNDRGYLFPNGKAVTRFSSSLIWWHRVCSGHSFFAAILLFVLISLAAFALPHKPTLMLLDSPINATWAANHGEAWRQKGFNGFLFEGLVDDLAPYPSERQSEEENTRSTEAKEWIVPGNWESLIVEIKGAINRLTAVGLDRNFLRLALLPEAPYFTDEGLRDIAANRLRLAGECCRRTGLRGIALDTQSQNALYDYRWDGHPPGVSSDALAKGARQFGGDVLRAFIRAYPEGEILLIAQSPESAAPLWFPFMEGVLESVGAAAEIPIQLALYDGGMPETVSEYRDRTRRISNLFQRFFSPSAYSCWTRQCGISFSLKPIYYKDDIPTAGYPLGQYRRALYAAALFGKNYTIIHAPEGGWWHIPPDISTQFSHLRQGGRARASFAPPVPVTVDAFAPRLHLSDVVHLGSIPVGGENMEVLQQGEKTLLLAWDGLAQELRIPTRTGMTTVMNLITEERHYFTPNAAEIVVPVQVGMLLITEVATSTYGVPAGLNMRLVTPIRGGITRAEVEVEAYNPLALPLTGTLTLTADPRYSLGTVATDIALKPGTSISFHRTIQGISSMGHLPHFSMNLYVAAEAPVVRTISFPVEPPELFSFRMDGPVQGSPLVLFQGDQLLPLVVASDVRGGVNCFDTGVNKEQWHIRLRGNFSVPPLLLKSAGNEPFIALQNTHGRIRFFNSHGKETVMIYPAESAITSSVVVNDPTNQAIHLAVATTDTVSIYDASGVLRNRFERQGIAYLASTPALPGQLFLVASTAHSDASDSSSNVMLGTYTLEGQFLWERELSQQPTCPPVIHGATNTTPPTCCLCDASGAVYFFDAEDGRLIAAYSGNKSDGTSHLISLKGTGKGVALFAKADSASLTLYALTGGEIEERWKLPFEHITALTVLPNDEGVVVGLKNGSIVTLAVTGDLLWEDHQDTGAITGLSFYVDSTRKDTGICIAASQSGVVRGLEIRSDLLLSENL